MVADDHLRPRRRRGDFVDVERRRVRGQHGPRLGDFVDLAEDFLLQLHVLEDGLDDDVGLVEVAVVERRLDHRQLLVDLRLRHLAPLDGDAVVAADRFQSAVEGRLIDLFQHDGNARVDVGHRDAAPHRPGADDGRTLDIERFDVFGQVGNLGDRPLAEEDVDHPLRFGGEETFLKEFGLFLAAFLERQLGGRFDGVDRPLRCLHAAPLFGRPACAARRAPLRWPPDRPSDRSSRASYAAAFHSRVRAKAMAPASRSPSIN